MSKFIMECPACNGYVEAATGFFAKKRIRCQCGNVIHVKTDRMVSRQCPSCGNSVVYDQAKGDDAKCPVCHAQLVTAESRNRLVHFHCTTCGCSLQADKAAVSITCPVCDTRCDVQEQVKLDQQRKDGQPALIKYEGDNKTFVWRHPYQDFVIGSQLIVHESQEAIFLRNGEALDSFPAGRYTLDTGVLPNMNRLYPLPMDGQPFHAEVYFVNLTTQMAIKWGTSSKVGLFDPATGMHVELGASGSFNLRVTDPRRLVIKLVGTTDSLTQAQIFESNGGYFRTLVMTKVKSNLARIIKEANISVLELDAHIDRISDGLRAAINAELESYGLTMPEFYVSNIVTPDDDPNFRRMKQQHADLYLRTREEQIRKAEAEAIFERKSVEAQTEARMKIIGAQGDAEAMRLRAQAEADAYRMQAEAEAQEMRMKGYSYQQETQRQVATEAVRNGGGAGMSAGGMIGGISEVMGGAMQLGLGLSAAGSVMGMTKEAIAPFTQDLRGAMQSGWTCSCGRGGIDGNFCPNCGAKKPEAGWTCACGKTGIDGNFCPNCGAKKPEAGWTCACGKTGIDGNFCPNCGSKKPEAGWTCACGKTGIDGNFCPNCGAKKPEAGWTCACGKTGIDGNFCPNCGAKKPEAGWTCACGKTGINGNFCPNCGAKKEG